MTLHGRITAIKQEISMGEFITRHPRLARGTGYILNFALGFLMACARIFGSCGPFGIAIVSRSGQGFGGILCLCGASAGYLYTGGFDVGIRYVSTCVLIYTVSFVLQNTRLVRSHWFMPMVTSLVTAVTGFLNTFEVVTPVPAVVIMLTEVILAGGCSFFYGEALSETERITDAAELRHGISTVILLASVLMAVAPIVFLDVISVGRVLAMLIVMTGAYKGGLLSGAATGAALGIAMDIAAAQPPVFSMAYTFSGVISGVFYRHNRFVFLLSYVLANAVAVLWTWSSSIRLEVLYECFTASVIFILLPGSLLSSVGGFLQSPDLGHGEVGLRAYTAQRIRQMGAAFADLYDTMRQSAEEAGNDNDIAGVFDRAAESVCSSCKNKELCWHQNYMDTLAILNDATTDMLKRGKLVRDALPERFAERCPSAYAFISAVNSELRALMYRRQFRTRLSENRTAAYAQYNDMAVIMDEAASELMGPGGADHAAERRLLRYLNGLDIEADVSVFRDKSGRLRATIESGNLAALFKERDYLERLSAVAGVRLCRPARNTDASGGKLYLLEAEPLAVSVGIAAMKKKGESVNGDKGTYFKTEQGVLCVILSDGMGSGKEAARESVAAVRILERFLRAGVEPAVAMKILNSVMLLKNGDDWGFATVDLMCINLFSGETCFYKYGAAPSYVRSGKNVRMIKGESLAAGLCAGEGAAPDVIKMKLKPGALALIASDGVLMQEDDKWIRNLLSDWEGGETKNLAKLTIQEAAKQYDSCDDMTVLAVYLENRA